MSEFTLTPSGPTHRVQEEPARRNPLSLSTWEDMERMANQVAKSGMFGINNPAQAICMFAIAQSEGIDALSVLRKYHVIEGKPSMRADAMLAEFKKAGGGVIYHIRTDKIVAATYFEDKKRITAEAEQRSLRRMEILMSLEFDELEAPEIKALYIELTKLNKEGEQTIVRTISDATAKGLNQGKDGVKTNWKRTPRAMLAARCDTEGIRIIMPGLIAGIMETNEALDLQDVQVTVVEETKTPEELKQEAEEMVREAITLPPKERSEKMAQASEIRTQAIEMEIEKEKTPEPSENPKTEEDYCLKHAGGLFKGVSVKDVSTDDLEIISESLQRRAQKNPDLYKNEADQVQKELDSRTPQQEGK
jgi:hypothetical protein